MPKHYQVVVKDDGKTFVRSLDGGEQLSPDASADIAKKITSTATEPSYVYIGYQAVTGRHKIGLSVEPPRRAKELDIQILHTIKCQAWGDKSARALERILHTFFKLMGQHIEGEWFHLTEFDVWDLRGHDTSEDGLFHKWYEWIITYIQKFQSVFNETKLPNPFSVTIEVERDFLDYKPIRQVALIYSLRWTAVLASRTTETMLAGFVQDYAESIAKDYIERDLKNKDGRSMLRP
jgi:hypothetical protein